MDALASVTFAIIIISNIQKLGSNYINKINNNITTSIIISVDIQYGNLIYGLI